MWNLTKKIKINVSKFLSKISRSVYKLYFNIFEVCIKMRKYYFFLDSVAMSYNIKKVFNRYFINIIWSQQRFLKCYVLLWNSNRFIENSLLRSNNKIHSERFDILLIIIFLTLSGPDGVGSERKGKWFNFLQLLRFFIICTQVLPAAFQKSIIIPCYDRQTLKIRVV